MDKWIPPNVGPPNEEGFRTFSFSTPEGEEIIRVSFNLDRQRDWLANTAQDESRYSRAERKRLRLLARIVAARDAFPSGNEEEALAIFRQASPSWIAESLGTYFPSFALLGLEAASDICVKLALNSAVETAGAPRMYDDKMVKKILHQFHSAAIGFLRIKPGRPVETQRHLSKTKRALKELEREGKIQRGKKRPTQELVSEKLKIEPRALRDWRKGCKLKWTEFLRALRLACKAEGNQGGINHQHRQ